MSSTLPPQIMLQHKDGPPAIYDILDLYDLALLLNYERYAREPRFRRSMLVDVARGEEDFFLFREAIPLHKLYGTGTHVERTGFLFKVEDLPFDEDQPDHATRADMLTLSMDPPRVHGLTDLELETIFYQSRSHDACFDTIALLQYLFELYPKIQPISVRTDSGLTFVTQMDHHYTATFTLHDPKAATVSVVLRGNPTYRQRRGRSMMHFPSTTYITGNEASMKHCAMVFVPTPKGSDLSTLGEGRGPRDGVVLDLASMQFGDAGRGLRGEKSLFVLEPMKRYKARMLTVAEKADEPVFGGPVRIQARHKWLREVARRAKERYDLRETEHWCGHCGAPAERLTCKCKRTWYCNAGHQKAAWPLHRHYCSVPPQGLFHARMGRYLFLIAVGYMFFKALPSIRRNWYH